MVSLALHGAVFLYIAAGRADKLLEVVAFSGGGRLAPLYVLLSHKLHSPEVGEGQSASVAPIGVHKLSVLDGPDSSLLERNEPAQPSVSSSSRDHGGLPMSTAGARSSEYLPVAKLSVGPTPLGEINLPWPPEEGRLGRFCAVFTLFVDELGVVQNIVADAPTLTPLMEETTKRVFKQARFSPAMLNGFPVKAIQRIEVVFESSSPTNEAGQVVFRSVL